MMSKVFMLGMALLMVGCGSFNHTEYASNDEDQYMKSKNGVPVTVPNGLTSTNISDFYVLPQQNQNAKVSIRPPVSK